MAEISFSLSEQFQKAFGYETPAFKPDFDKLPKTYLSKNGTPYYADDALGREYFMPVTLKYSVTTPTGVGNDSFTIGKTYVLPYPVISVSCSKTIIETPLTDRRGTMKELISIRDYDITIKGLIINTTNDFPESDVTILRELFEQNTSVQIQCALTDIFLLRPDRSGSDNVVILELIFPPINGVKNVRPYEMRLLSDEPFNLTDIS